jgi:hypothetical protein
MSAAKTGTKALCMGIAAILESLKSKLSVEVAVHTHTKMLLTVSFLLLSFGMWAQEQEKDYLVEPDLLARLSYENLTMVWPPVMRHVCVAVTRDGEYRIVRSMVDGQMQRLRGKMSKEQLQQLTELLGAAEFRALSGDHVGVIRQEAEVFSAEIPSPMRQHVDGARQWMDRDVWRLQWLNADGERPFPGSVAKVVDWLRHFEPKSGKSFVYAEFPDVCPSRGLRLVQPAVAENAHP